LAGECAFIDYSGGKPRLADPLTGEVRAVELFVNGDVDEIMPSIYNGRASGRKRETEESTSSEPTEELPEGAEVPGEAGEDPEQEIPVGMPGASPFVRG
jgi:hypothetical protein